MDALPNADDLTIAGFRLSWPGHGGQHQPDRRREGRLAALLRLALRPRLDTCVGWPVSLGMTQK